MKRILFLIAAVIFIKSVSADVVNLPVSPRSQCEIVDVSKIYQLKASLEADSNLVFTISRFTYFELNDSQVASIKNDISNGIWPTFKNLGTTFSETHEAYDEAQSHPYTGQRYLAIQQTGDEIEFIVFWVNPDKSRASDE